MDTYKKLGKKEEITLQTADFYVHEYWPNGKRHPTDIRHDLYMEWVVETDAGKMLVAYMWWDTKTRKHYIRRAKTMNTTKWID